MGKSRKRLRETVRICPRDDSIEPVREDQIALRQHFQYEVIGQVSPNRRAVTHDTGLQEMAIVVPGYRDRTGQIVAQCDDHLARIGCSNDSANKRFRWVSVHYRKVCATLLHGYGKACAIRLRSRGRP